MTRVTFGARERGSIANALTASLLAAEIAKYKNTIYKVKETNEEVS